MKITVARNGQVLGQHEAEAIPALVQSGAILPTDHYWHDAMAGWETIQSKWPAGTIALAAGAPPVLTGTGANVAPATPSGPIDLAAIAQANPAIIRGARWFWWVAGLSLINTILAHSESRISFVIGLGFTLVVDAMLQKAIIVALIIDALAIGFFFGAGWFAGKGRLWAFVLGIVAYTGDLLLCLTAKDWMMIGFHAFALFQIGSGAMALRADVRAARSAA
jgi:hypothetical protein